MYNNEEYLENFDTVFEDVKFTANSFVRLKILASLYDSPQNMREMTKTTGLSYSSISSNMHDLELKNLLYR
jgi:predicted transcriptional regulator